MSQDWFSSRVISSRSRKPLLPLRRTRAQKHLTRYTLLAETLEDRCLLSVDPFVEQQKLTASDSVAGDYFGCSVANSADGRTVVVGAYGDTGKAIDSGSAYVYQWNVASSSLVEQQKLTASKWSEGGYFGYSVAISADGKTVVVGAPYDSSGGLDSGSAYVFQWNASSASFSEQQILTASDAAEFDAFGQSVTISADGQTIVVGAPLDDGTATDSGSAYVYRWNVASSSLVEQQKLTASDGAAGDKFGYSVGISADGRTVAVGALVEQQKLTDSGLAAGDGFGHSVGVSADGQTVVVGAPWNDDEGTDSGSAYVYQWNAASLSLVEQQKLTASDASYGGYFGSSVAMSAGGQTVVVHAHKLDDASFGTGSAYVYLRDVSSSSFVEQQKLTASDVAAGDGFGRSVGISADGGTAFFGAPWNDDNGRDSGSAYVFATKSNPSPRQLADLVTGSGSSNPQDLVRVGDVVFFTAQTAEHGRELWKTDGTPEGTALVKDIVPGVSGSLIDNLVAVGNTLFFTATDGSHGLELWKSNGSAAGTVMVKDIWPGTAGSSPSSLTAVGNQVFFAAADGVNGFELWASDGSEGGTRLIKDMESGRGSSSPTYLKEFNGKLLLSAYSIAYGREPWISDGTADGTVVLQVEPGGPGSAPRGFAVIGEGAFFAATSVGVGAEIYRTDGTPGGTTLVKDINPGALGSEPRQLVNVGGTLLFAANDGFTGQELWKSNGTPDGTMLVRDIYPGITSSSIQSLVDLNSKTVFAADDGGAAGYELWSSDGTPEGTVLLYDINPGDAGSEIGVNGIVEQLGLGFFSANDGIHGAEPWRTDGTSSETALVADLYADLASSSPASFVGLGPKVVFVATTELGRELWVMSANRSPVADAGGPYSVQVGDPVISLDATGSSDPEDNIVNYSWDLNGDGVFGDIQGQTPSLSWSQLVALAPNVAIPGTHQIALKVIDAEDLEDLAAATLQIDVNLADIFPYVEETLVLYHATTGTLTLDTRVPLSSIVLHSETGAFATPVPGAEVSTPQDIKITSPNGIGDLSFFGLLPPGLTAESLAADLKVLALDMGGTLLPLVKLAFVPDGTAEALVTYDAVNGGMGGSSTVQLTTLLLTSASEMFHGPCEHLESEFDVCHASTLFKLAPHGVDRIYFGEVAPLGLTAQFVAGDVSITGSKLPEGAISSSLVHITAMTLLNSAPVAVPGGPYVINEGTGLALNGGQSSDPDGDELLYAWDVNGDGVFSDASGPQPVLNWSNLQTLVPPVGEGSFTVTLRVSDPYFIHESSTQMTVLNVPPQALPDNAAIQADDSDGVELNVLANDVDPVDPLALMAVNAASDAGEDVQGTYGSLNWEVTGHVLYRLDPANAEVNALLAGETLTEIFEYDASDGTNSRLSTLTITIHGTVPIELFVDTGQLFEPGPTHDADLADLDGDGDLDAFVTQERGAGNRVLFNDGFGNFTDSGQKLGTANSIYAALGDVDKDGDVDAFVATRQANLVWLNDGHGRFTDSGQRLGMAYSIDVALGDLDSDGDLDAYVTNYLRQPDEVWFNNGQGVFSDSGQRLGNTDGKSVELGDLDGDGDLDAFVGNENQGQPQPNQVWLNNGHGIFTDSGQRLGLAQTQHVALGDLDADGDLDAVEAGGGPNNIWFNNGFGVFTASGQILTSHLGSHVALGDLDLDGDLDAYFANWSNLTDEIWLNRGDGVLFHTLQVLDSSTSSHVALGDLDSDGDLDAFVAEYDEPISVYENLTTTLNVPPMAQDDVGYATDEDTMLPVDAAHGLLTNDRDPNRDPFELSAFDSVSVQGAAVIVAADGSFVYDPTSSGVLQALPAGILVHDTFEYAIADDAGLTDWGTVRVALTGRNDAPAADDEQLAMLKNDPALNLTAVLLTGDSDPDAGDALRISAVDTTGTVGIVTLVDGVVMYQPGPGFDPLQVGAQAVDSFAYTVTDQHGATATATVSITVAGQSDLAGDFDGDGVIDVEDIDLLCDAINRGESDPLFDLNGSGAISLADLDELILNILHTSYGDANLDGRFNSEDFVEVFQAGQYEDTIEDNSDWATGDWNADREFDSADFVRAFQGGAYEQPAALPIGARLDADTRVAIAQQPARPVRTGMIRHQLERSRPVALDPPAADRLFAHHRGDQHGGLRGAAGSLEQAELKVDCVGPELPMI